VTIGQTPLLIGHRTGGNLPVICPTAQANAVRHINATGKSPRGLWERETFALSIIHFGLRAAFENRSSDFRICSKRGFASLFPVISTHGKLRETEVAI
jgi:hypothetical protein